MATFSWNKDKQEETVQKPSLLKKVVSEVNRRPISRIKNVVSKVLQSEPVKRELDKGRAISAMPIKEQVRTQLSRTGNILKDVAQGTARSAGQLHATLTGQKELKPKNEIEAKVQKVLFGEKPVKAFGGSVEQTKKDTGLPGIVAAPLVAGSIGLDLFGGGAGKTALSKLAKLTDINLIKNELKSVKGVAADSIEELAPLISKAKTEKEVIDIIENSKTQSVDKVVDNVDTIQKAKASGQSFDEWVKRQEKIGNAGTTFAGQSIFETFPKSYSKTKAPKITENTADDFFDAGYDLFTGNRELKATSFETAEGFRNSPKIFQNKDDKTLVAFLKKPFNKLGAKEKYQLRNQIITEDGGKTFFTVEPEVIGTGKTRSQLKAEWDRVKSTETPMLKEEQLDLNKPSQIDSTLEPQKIDQDNFSLIKTIPEEEFNVNEQKIIEALKKAKPLRGKQEAIYSKERSKRLGQAMAVGKDMKGEKGFFAQKSKLKGEFNKVEFESIREAFNQETIDSFFQKVKSKLSGFDQIKAQDALLKLFAKEGTTVPTRKEIALLEEVFSKEFTDTLIDKMPAMRKAGIVFSELINLPKTWASGLLDFSGSLRQGIIVAPRFRKEYYGAFKKQFKMMGSQKAYQAVMDSITSNKWFKDAEEAGLAITDLGSNISKREEQYAASWGEHMPSEYIERNMGKVAAAPFKAYNKTIGRLIHATSRSYSGFLNKLRMDIYARKMNEFQELGMDPKNNFDLKKNLAEFINSATGRGDLGKLEPAANILNGIFYSPKWIKSRLDLIGIAANPANYFSSNPVKKEALKTIYTFLGTLAGTLALINQIPGVEIGEESNSADFGKIIIRGKHRLDLSGGLQQYVRMVSQLITGKYISSVTGKEITLGEGFKPLTKGQILGRQIQSKEAPVLAFITKIMKQQDFKGDPISVPKEFVNMITPMTPRDAYNLIKEDPDLAPLILGSIFGASLQTYSQQSDKKSGGNKSSSKSGGGGSGGGGFSWSK